ncbi:MAG TPA: hypothetical protein VMB85_10110 [Bryobacteraceae bacterium]|jgi:hypothetical protein|nr:hypothetical protein [Bryobacteraceae bacterium]
MNNSQWSRRPHYGCRERRAESRDRCQGAVILDVLAPHPRRAVSADVVDVGSGGLRLTVPFFVTPGSILRIHLSEAVVQAEVKYCSCEARKYHVGVGVEEICGGAAPQ